MKNEEESTSEFSSFNSQFICYICILFKRIWKRKLILLLKQGSKDAFTALYKQY